MHGLADVHHGVEDDRVPGWLHLVSAVDKHPQTTNTLPRDSSLLILNDTFSERLLDEDLHDGSAHLHPHAVLLEHVQEGQETLLEDRANRWK